MSSPSRRRSDRVSLTVLLDASGTDLHGQEFSEPAKSLIIGRGGAVIVLGRELRPEQEIHIRRKAPSEAHRESRVRIVNQTGQQRDGFLYSVEILDPQIDFWGIDFPSITENTEAVAKMLLECSHCRTREVAHLNELELRAFETNRGVARHCKACRVPSIWTQVSNEDEKKIAARAARGRRASETAGAVPSDGEQRERQRMRLQTRLTACIRQPGEDDELAVCEDISPIGMCFRSKRRYLAQALVDVAVPYSPDTANIFLLLALSIPRKSPRLVYFATVRNIGGLDLEPGRIGSTLQRTDTRARSPERRAW